jgi:peptidoglycan/LPS O-acetylase OafA/YrhL
MAFVPAQASSGSPNTIGALAGLRGAAALSIVIYHYVNRLAWSVPTMFVAHGYLAVDLFFVLSGYLMAMNYSAMFAAGWSRAAYVRFLGRRIARIYPLYLAATIAGFVLVELRWLDYPSMTPLGPALGLNLMMVQVWGLVQSFDGPGWSISAEWAAYLLFPLLLIPTMFAKPMWGWLFALACVAVLARLCSFSASLHDPTHMPGALLYFWDPWLALPVLRCLPEFGLGMLAFRFAATPYGSRIGTSAVIAPLTCLAIVVLAAQPETDLEVVLLLPLLIVSLASSTHAVGRMLASPLPRFIGALSYSVYLIHFLLIGAVVRGVYAVGHGFGLPPLAFKVGTAAIGIALTILVAYVAYRTIELPGRRWLRATFEGI